MFAFIFEILNQTKIRIPKMVYFPKMIELFWSFSQLSSLFFRLFFFLNFRFLSLYKKKIVGKNPLDIWNIRPKMSTLDSIEFFVVVGKISICLMNGFTMRWSFSTLLRLSDRTNAISFAWYKHEYLRWFHFNGRQNTISLFFFSKHFPMVSVWLVLFLCLMNAKSSLKWSNMEFFEWSKLWIPKWHKPIRFMSLGWNTNNFDKEFLCLLWFDCAQRMKQPLFHRKWLIFPRFDSN